MCMKEAIVYVCAWPVSSPMVAPHSGRRMRPIQVYQSEEKWKKMVGGDGIEPPTLSV